MKLSAWKKLIKNNMEAESYGEETAFDTDSPPCPDCGGMMIFYGHDENGDFPSREGYWQCPTCRKRITEDDLYD